MSFAQISTPNDVSVSELFAMPSESFFEIHSCDENFKLYKNLLLYRAKNDKTLFKFVRECHAFYRLAARGYLTQDWVNDRMSAYWYLPRNVLLAAFDNFPEPSCGSKFAPRKVWYRYILNVHHIVTEEHLSKSDVPTKAGVVVSRDVIKLEHD